MVGHSGPPLEWQGRFREPATSAVHPGSDLVHP